jgi:vacuolar-type H+-ATPase subunit I/STV1
MLNSTITRIAGAAVVGFALSGTASAQAPESLQSSIDVERQISQSAAASQQRVDELAEETRAMLDEYLQVRQQTDRLSVYNDQVERLIRNQEEEKRSIEEQLEEVEVVEQEIVPLMIRMIESLERFVELDVPFLPDERANRIERLWNTMDRSDVTVAEKYRNVMEAYQIEAEYGRTIEAYRGSLEVGGEPRDVDFLRVGRMMLAYQTLDREETGFWNPVTREWEALPDSYGSSINQGLRIARQQAASDILHLPVPAPERVQ